MATNRRFDDIEIDVPTKREEPHKMFGLPLKYLVLVLLIAQNAAHTLLIRYSRGIRHDEYNISSVVVVVELVKMLLSMFMIYIENPSRALERFSDLTVHSRPMSIPALIYFVQKLLSFVGLQYLDSAVYAIVTQLKLLTTALFSVLILKTKLNPRKWRALLLLLVGVILIHLAAVAHNNSKQSSYSEFMVGLAACLGIAVLSGFAGVYIEKALKAPTEPTIWEMNYQLSLYGVVVAIISALTVNRPSSDVSFFHGWNLVTCLVVIVFSLGGILVALIGKYADMILKGFATGIAIIVTSLLNYLFFDGILNLQFGLGVTVVLISLFNYNERTAPPDIPSPKV